MRAVRVGELPTRGDMFCFGGRGCQCGSFRKHLHDFESAECLEGGAVKEVCDLASEVVCGCETSALHEQPVSMTH